MNTNAAISIRSFLAARGNFHTENWHVSVFPDFARLFLTRHQSLWEPSLKSRYYISYRENHMRSLALQSVDS